MQFVQDLIFFLENGKQVELEGDTGVLHNDTNNMEINGNVRVRYDEAYELSTDRLLYDQGKELIHTAAPILVEGEGIVLKGQGMRLELPEMICQQIVSDCLQPGQWIVYPAAVPVLPGSDIRFLNNIFSELSLASRTS